MTLPKLLSLHCFQSSHSFLSHPIQQRQMCMDLSNVNVFQLTLISAAAWLYRYLISTLTIFNLNYLYFEFLSLVSLLLVLNNPLFEISLWEKPELERGRETHNFRQSWKSIPTSFTCDYFFKPQTVNLLVKHVICYKFCFVK